MITAGRVDQHQFSQVPRADIPRSIFNRSCTRKQTMEAGLVIPFFVDEILPGDTFNVNATLLTRLTTPQVPFMDNLYMDIFWFFVPNRLVWSHWQNFMGEKDDPADVTTYAVPYTTSPAGGWLEETLADYLGLPIRVAGLQVNVLPFRGYMRIYRDWFKDENLIATPAGSTIVGDGPDASTLYSIQKRGKRHDYFTSCLPWPQKGNAVSIPLGTEAPVLGLGAFTNVWTAGPVTVYESNGATRSYANFKDIHYEENDRSIRVEEKGTTGFPYIRADLTNATAATINSLRQAFQLQRMAERDARGGTRYVEVIKAHFGVTSPDARLQRAEFLGGTTERFNITPVAQTSSPTGSYAPGRLSGFGTMVARCGFTKSFTEHGYVFGLCSIRADLTYQQGINRMFIRSTKYDFYWPALANIGEQAVYNKEIYAQGTADDALIFGYQERYAEYRYKPSTICGKLRSTATAPLDFWHLSQKFLALPTLSQAFIEEAVPISRIQAVAETGFVMDSDIRVQAARPMPTYSIPGLMDHY